MEKKRSDKIVVARLNRREIENNSYESTNLSKTKQNTVDAVKISCLT